MTKSNRTQSQGSVAATWSLYGSLKFDSRLTSVVHVCFSNYHSFRNINPNLNSHASCILCHYSFVSVLLNWRSVISCSCCLFLHFHPLSVLASVEQVHKLVLEKMTSILDSRKLFLLEILHHHRL